MANSERIKGAVCIAGVDDGESIHSGLKNILQARHLFYFTGRFSVTASAKQGEFAHLQPQ
jgi:hypothetical protein